MHRGSVLLSPLLPCNGGGELGIGLRGIKVAGTSPELNALRFEGGIPDPFPGFILFLPDDVHTAIEEGTTALSGTFARSSSLSIPSYVWLNAIEGIGG